MTESSPEEGSSPPENVAYDLEWNRLDHQGFSSVEIRQRLGDPPVAKNSQEIPFISPTTFTPEKAAVVDLAELRKSDLAHYDSQALSDALEALSTGEIEDFDGFDQAEIAREVDRRYQEALVSSSTQGYVVGEDDIVAGSGLPEATVSKIYNDADNARSGSELDDARFTGTSIRPLTPPPSKRKFTPRKRPYYGPKG